MKLILSLPAADDSLTSSLELHASDSVTSKSNVSDYLGMLVVPSLY